MKSENRANHSVRMWAVILASIFINSLSFANSGITYHGKILRPDDTPVTSSTTQFRIQIRTPGTENCLLWEEYQTKDLNSTSGVFTVTISDTSEPTLIPNTLPYTLERVFSNRLGFTGLSGCSSGNSYTPSSSADGRILQVSFRESGAMPWEQMPITKVNFVPLALNTVQLEGYSANEFLKIDPASSYTTLTATQVNTLMDIIAGTNTQYLRPTSSFSGDVTGNAGATVVEKIRGTNVVATAPTSGQVLKFDGTNWVPSTDATGTAPSDSSYTVKGVVQIDTNLATSGLNITSGILSLPNVVTAGSIGSATEIPVITYDAKGRITSTTFAAPNDASKLPLAGGTMTGSIDMGTQNITNATSVAATNISTRNVILNDNDTNTATIRAPTDITAGNYTLTLPLTDGNNGEVLSTDGSGNLSWVVPSSGSLTNVTSANSYVTINTPSAGVREVQANVGTSANTLAAGDDTRITGALQTSDYNADIAGITGANVCTGSEKPYWNTVSGTWDCTAITGFLTAETDSSVQAWAKQAPAARFVTTGNTLDLAPRVPFASADPALAQNGQTLRWNNTSGTWEWFTPGVAGAGITQIGGQSGSSQSFAVSNDNSIAAPTLTSASDIHTFKYPLASATGVTAGLLAKSDYDSFTGKLTSPLTTKGDLLTRDTTNHIRLPVGTDGQILSANSGTVSGLQWITPTNGDITDVVAGAGLTGGATSGSATLDIGAGTGIVVNANDVAIDVGTAAGKIVQVQAGGKLPALDGSDLTNLDAGDISAGTLPVARGGTGATTLTSGSLVVGNGTSAVTGLAAGANGNVLYGTGASTWASGTPDTAGLVDKSSAQTISGAKTLTNNLTLNAQNSVRFADSDSSNYVALRSPATVGTNVTFTLPTADGTANQVLKTDGSGNLGWSTPSSGANPAGSGSEIQFRQNATTFGANANFVWDNTNSRLGIGTNSPQNRVHLYHPRTDTAAGYSSSAYLNTSLNASANSATLFRVMTTQADSSGSFDYNQIIGSSNEVWHNGDGTVDSHVGIVGLSYNNSVSSGVVTNSIGVHAMTDVNQGATTTNAAAVLAQANLTGSGTIDNAMGTSTSVYAGGGNVAVASGLYTYVDEDGGAIDTAMGIHIGTIEGTNKWSLYASDAAAPSYFAGSVGIGTPSTDHILGVVGATNRLAEFISTGTNDATVFIDNAAGGYQSSIFFRDAGTNIIQIGKQFDNSFFMWDNIRAKNFFIADGDEVSLQPEGGNVGIGTWNPDPAAMLHVEGQIMITGGTPGVGKVLTSDANGLATWEDASGGVTSVTSGNSYISIATGTTTPVITANVGTAANTLAAGNDSRITGAVQQTAYAADISAVAGSGCTGSEKPYWNTVSDAWACAAITGFVTTSTGFVQNGNSFGAAAVLGTNEAQPLHFETDSTTKMTILANGNVGIGETSPSYKLVTRTTAATANRTMFSSEDGGTDMTLESIGTTGGPAYNIQVTGPGWTKVNDYQVIGSLGVSAHDGAALRAATEIRSQIDGSVSSGNLPASMAFYVNPGSTTTTEAMRIAASGNVGIGTNNPAAKLDVDGVTALETVVETTSAYTNSGAAYTIPDTTLGIRRINLTASAAITLPAFTTPTGRVWNLTVFVKQAGAGTYAPSFTAPAGDSILWDQSATVPPAATGVGKISIYQFIKAADETTWYGSLIWKQN